MAARLTRRIRFLPYLLLNICPAISIRLQYVCRRTQLVDSLNYFDGFDEETGIAVKDGVGCGVAPWLNQLYCQVQT
jgi:hypothetical protein